jgi:type IV pilus assembly protein PilB
VIPQRALAIALAKQNRLAYLDLSNHEIARDVVKYIPEEIARKHVLIPVEVMGNALLVAFADPANIVLCDELKIRSKKEIVPLIALRKEIEDAIQRIYGKGMDAISEMIKDIAEDDILVVNAPAAEEAPPVEGVNDAPVIRLVNLIVMEAVRAGASDIHIEPEESKLRVRYRIDGVLKEMPAPPRRLQNTILSRIKIMADMNISERRRPQDGRFKVQVEGHSVDFRVSSLPTVFGEKIVLRLLDKSNLSLDLTQLGFEEEPLQMLQRAIRRPYGLILVTGPTGSGKSTTLYSALSTINDTKKNIVTVEDPVEYLLEGVNQVQTHHEIGLDFASGLRTILRQDPDVVMIGEIRDMETAEICIKAALTGHLVFSTLHTNDAPGSVDRLRNMGVEPFMLAASLTLIAAQRLARRICPRCKEEYQPEPEILKELAIPEYRQGTAPTFSRGKGCEHCNGTGYRGRVALYEIMEVNDAIKKSILQGCSGGALKDLARTQGMKSLRESGIRKILDGLTTIEEVLAATYEV